VTFQSFARSSIKGKKRKKGGKKDSLRKKKGRDTTKPFRSELPLRQIAPGGEHIVSRKGRKKESEKKERISGKRKKKGKGKEEKGRQR